ncbi:methyltransferase domain-containing protein [Arenimonas sp.]|nr:methyltransferase domain-containing protein [Candidatus Parcubacteria bacterium]
MNQFVKLTFTPGLKEVVLQELKEYILISESEHTISIELPNNFQNILSLKSINSAYIATSDKKYNPRYLHKHKSILGNLIEKVIIKKEKEFKTFKIRCAGSQTQEIIEIEKYIQETYTIKKNDVADLEIYINKIGDDWEISVRLSPRPLSVRDYKISNIKGGLNPNIAYAINTFCNLKNSTSYLNIFSGSGTLLIEAGLVNPHVKLVGLDIDKKTNSLAIQNIKKAGLIKIIKIKTGDIFESPDVEKFDVITSNLPFGMQISKGEDLKKLYQQFIDYSEKVLYSKGRLVVYTTEYEILELILKNSKFEIVKKLNLKIPTNVNSYLYPRIFVCDLI